MTSDMNAKSAGPGSSLPSLPPLDKWRIAVLLPCYNEALTIAKVIGEFRSQLPTASIYVFDNNSTDQTAEIAMQAGAVVVRERRQGKGFVVQSMFRTIEADIYIMADGDDTYPASEVHRLMEPVLQGEADMVVGSRLHTESNSRFNRLNLLGNRLFLSTLNLVFHVRLTDILSGYRVFSRQFVKTVALVGGGFEVETELTIKTLEAGFRIAEVPVDLGQRPEGSCSKIRPLRDGIRILCMIFALFRDYKPLTFFGSLALARVAAGLVPGTIVIMEYLQTGQVLRMPSAVLAVGLVLLGMLMLTAGIILHSLTRRIRELEYQLQGLSVRKTYGPQPADEGR
ncbi:MAG: glycosyltransferase family 2 protein [Thermoguttaceae bacterium]